MTKSEAIALYGRLSTSRKLILLLDMMQQLTIVVRSVFHDYAGDTATTSRLAYTISEVNHRLTSAASALLRQEPGYPDDVLIEMLYDRPQHPELAPYFPFVLKQAMQRLES